MYLTNQPSLNKSSKVNNTFPLSDANCLKDVSKFVNSYGFVGISAISSNADKKYNIETSENNKA